MRTIFMGSPNFAVPILRSLNDSYPVVGVVTQPDRPAGRGRTIASPPVKNLAIELGLPLIQPRRIRDPDTMAQIRVWAPDLIVVAAFGQILRQELLDLPAFGCLNVHASLLPRWRGAAPIQAAIFNGDPLSGITIMRMDAGIDTGAILGQTSVPILDTDNAETLSDRLAHSGALLLLKLIPKYISGEIQPIPQVDDQATYAPMLKKEDGELNFNRSALSLSNQVRAYNPWPGAYLKINDQILRIISCSIAHEIEPGGSLLAPGQRTRLRGKPAVQTGDGILILEQVQPAGKKPMPGQAYLLGAREWDLQ